MSRLVKKSLRLAGHSTSVALEEDFWTELEAIATQRGQSLADLVATIDAGRHDSLSGALRLFVLRDLRKRVYSSEDGPPKRA